MAAAADRDCDKFRGDTLEWLCLSIYQSSCPVCQYVAVGHLAMSGCPTSCVNQGDSCFRTVCRQAAPYCKRMCLDLNCVQCHAVALFCGFL